NITLDARAIEVGAGANLLAHATPGFAAGDVTLTAHDTYEQAWSFLSVPNYRWIETEATIDVDSDANLTGHDVTLQTTADTKKSASLGDPNNPNALLSEFSTPTRAVVLGDLDTNPITTRQDLIVGTLGRGIVKYSNVNDAFNTLPTAIDSDITLQTLSLALGDVDHDGDPDLVSGNFGQANRLYLNDGLGNFATGEDIDIPRDATAVALANLDADPELELVVATNEGGIFLYQFNPVTGTFDPPTTIEAGAFDTSSLALGDVDADGDADLVVGNRGQQNRLYLNSGGTFGAGTPLGAALGTTALGLGHFGAAGPPAGPVGG